MDILVAAIVVLIFIFLILSGLTRELCSGDYILIIIGVLSSIALYQGWEPGLTTWLNEQQNANVESMTNSNNVNNVKNIDDINKLEKTELEPVESMYDITVNDPTDTVFEKTQQEKDYSVYTVEDELTDFDDYGQKGYIPGYSDVLLYNKDGSDPFADLYRGPTEEGKLKFGNYKNSITSYDGFTGDGDSYGTVFESQPTLNRMLREVGGRADNHAGQLSAKMQSRAKENMVNTTRNNRRAWDTWYGKELDENENRNWWGQDQLYHPISRLN